ncbi:MAG: alkaline phosphatase family protein, partial [Mangrovimonas sp.]|nr:alkaline phosphatase family protein [Mangrovimonas sp.]
ESNKIPAGYANTKDQKDRFGKFMETTYGSSDLVENVSNNQIFLNHEKLKELGLNLEEVEQAIVDEIITYDNIYKAYTAVSMNSSSNSSGIEQMLQNGYNQKRSGDVLFIFDPSVISYGKTGSTHGSGFNYDTHVPLLFMGKGIKHGSTYQHTEITDVAPTACALLGISFPNGTYGSPLDFIIKE